MTELSATQRATDYLHEHIPLTRAMQIRVTHYDGLSLACAAPLAPNINHRSTVFGGSLSGIGTIAAWTLLHLKLEEAAQSARLVIFRHTMHYDRPAMGDFEARCAFDDSAAWDRFLDGVRRKGVARITLHSEVLCGGESIGRFEGDFVAINDSPKRHRGTED